MQHANPGEELRQHLKEQVCFLEESSRLFDQGKEFEAKRLAVAIRVLCHDTTQSHSLLQQLGVKESMTYWSTVFADPTASTRRFVGIGMQIRFSGGDRYVPNLVPPQRRIEFAKWWDESPVIVEGAEHVTRKRAVLALANKDGGAHVDPSLSDLERRMLRTDFMGWESITITGAQKEVVRDDRLQIEGQEVTMRLGLFRGGQVGSDDQSMGSPISAIVRQAAHELCGTIREQLNHLLV